MTYTKIATLNLPSQVRGAKSGLFKHPRRTRAAVRLWNEDGITIVALQELATMSRATIRARARWGLVTSTNDIFPLRRIGNGVAYRKDIWKKIAKKVHRINCPGRPRGLNMIIVLLEHRKTGEQVFVYALHNPTRRDASEQVRRAILAEEIRVCEVLASTGVAVLPAGDFNDGAVTFGAALVCAHHVVDWIFGYNLVRVDNGNDTSVKGTITDHGAMPWAIIQFDNAKRATEIPDLAA